MTPFVWGSMAPKTWHQPGSSLNSMVESNSKLADVPFTSRWRGRWCSMMSYWCGRNPQVRPRTVSYPASAVRGAVHVQTPLEKLTGRAYVALRERDGSRRLECPCDSSI